jgi:TRAP-type C4-dicarboxylate transport system permease small subunit
MGLNLIRWLDHFEKVMTLTSRILNNIGMAFLLLLMLLITTDVLLRTILNQPIRGANELAEFMMIIAVYLAVAYAQRMKAHVAIDLLYSRFPKRAKMIVDCFIYLLSLIICSLIAWQAFVNMKRLLGIHRVSDVLNLPVAPFQLVLAIGFIIFCLVLLFDFLDSLRKVIKI